MNSHFRQICLMGAAILSLLTMQAHAATEQAKKPPAKPAVAAPSKATKPAMPEPTASIKLSAEDKRQLQRVAQYLQEIKGLSAGFSQTSPDGAISNGKFYLQRPGKLRMEYEPPTPVLVLCKDGNMIYYDKELDQVTHVPLDSSLVTFLIRDKISFDSSVSISHIEKGFKVLRVEMTQAKYPKDGSLLLEFSDEPLALRNIIVTDSGGQSTAVSLMNAKFEEKLPAELFVFKDPHLGKAGSIKK